MGVGVIVAAEEQESTLRFKRQTSDASRLVLPYPVLCRFQLIRRRIAADADPAKIAISANSPFFPRLPLFFTSFAESGLFAS
jgi:hypothetical protein